MAAPWMSLLLVLIVWAVFSFAMRSLVGSDALASPSMLATARIVNTVLGFVGILSVIAIPIFIIVGIVILVKKDESLPSTQPPVQPPMEPPVQPPMGQSM